MTALSDALDHSQRQMLNALYKVYTRGADEPDDQMALQLMRDSGCDDDLQAQFLIRCYRYLRENPEPMPAANGHSVKAPPKQVVEEQRWTRGKHEGQTLADTPEEYLKWAAKEHADPIARSASAAELKRRAEGVPF